jgi:D-alanine-D-alanine ligase
MAKRKLQIGVLFGGRSTEHEVSIVSARSVMEALDKKKYQAVPIGVTKAGRFITGESVFKVLASGTKKISPALMRILPPDPAIHALLPLQRKAASAISVDVVIPLIHGTYGEDGTVQGLLELAGIPYVGAGVLGSALGMDKVAQKLIYRASGLPTPRFDYFTAFEFKSERINILRRLQRLGLPVFVKPANLGSSVGISKVKQASRLPEAIRLAACYAKRIIVEQAVPSAMEIEVAVLGNDKPRTSLPGQIIASNEFYDYNAKYVDGKSQAIIPAPLPRKVTQLIRQLALRTFRVLDLAGMARVDFLVNSRSHKVYVNEVNTIPGFTSISMYPKLWEATGLSYPHLLDELIRLALERFRQKQSLRTTYQPKVKWYN